MNGEQIGLDFERAATAFANAGAKAAEAVQRFGVVFAELNAGTRRTDPVTSHEAEARVRPHASTGRRAVLSALALYGPLTDFELAERTGWQQTSIGKRRGECVALGYVEAFTAPDGTKCKRPSPSGSPAIVWSITQAGRRAHEGMKGTNV
jgi:hypothetical protein